MAQYFYNSQFIYIVLLTQSVTWKLKALSRFSPQPIPQQRGLEVFHYLGSLNLNITKITLSST